MKLVVASICVLVGFAAPLTASAQETQPATIADVVSGDMVIALLANGSSITVALVGIDAPDVDECGGRDAREALEGLVGSTAVSLRADPLVAPVDGQGRISYYVDRSDGLDAGLEMVRRGWAQALELPPFQRSDAYYEAEYRSLSGVWADCGGHFHLTPAEQLQMRLRSGKGFVRRYYRRVSNRQYRVAWNMLGGPVKRKLGHGFRSWRSGFRGSLRVSVTAAVARPAGRRVVVRVRLRSRDRDVCDGRAVSQRFRGNIVLAPRGETWTIVKFRIVKTGGRAPRLAKSDCPPPKPSPQAPAPPTVDCQGYDPCIGPGSDVDCLGGGGNGPRYVPGPVAVNGADPYGLDSDGDGVGCEDD